MISDLDVYEMVGKASHPIVWCSQSILLLKCVAVLLTKPFLLILYGMIMKPLQRFENLFIYCSLCSKTV